MQHKKILFVFLVIFLSSFSLAAQKVDGVIKKYVAFIGGKKSWEKVKTLKTSGEYDYGGMKFPFTTFAKKPNLYKFVVPLEGKYYAQAFDGKQGWKIDAFKNETSPTLLTGKLALSMANEADVELEDAFIDYKRKGHQAILDGKDTVDGKNCLRVKFIRKNGAVETYYFDESTSALLMKTAVSKNGEMQGTILNTRYSDYREIDGIKIPFKSVSNSNDQVILDITIEKVEVNAAIDDREFQFEN
jgi:outer membrane lipoprotein-sorting protein